MSTESKQKIKRGPELLKSDNSFYLSKMKMKHWDKIAWAIIASKFPMKKIW